MFVVGPESTGRRHVFRVKRGDVMSSSTRRSGKPGDALLAVIISLCLFPVFLAATLLRRLLGWLAVNVGLRAEFLADDLGAQLGSTDAAVSFMRRLALGRSVTAYERRAKNQHADAARAEHRKTRDVDAETATALWSGLREHLDSIPDHEFQRQIRISGIKGTAVDVVHPANHLRVRLLAERPRRAAALEVTEQEWQAVNAELAPCLQQAAQRLLR